MMYSPNTGNRSRVRISLKSANLVQAVPGSSKATHALITPRKIVYSPEERSRGMPRTFAPQLAVLSAVGHGVLRCSDFLLL